MDKFRELTEYILEWNEKINVTAIRDSKEFMIKNIEDSLELSKLPEYAAAEEIMDMGTGGGFPGLPLAMTSPEKNFLLVDSIGKKLKVIDDVCGRLGIKNVKTLHQRAEDLNKNKKFDLVTSRAVANLSTLSEYCLPFVKIGGYFIAFKTEDSLEEIEAAKKAIDILGGKIEKIVKYTEIDSNVSPDNSGHLFVVIKKEKETPPAYPRKAGEPSKKPL